MRKPDNITKIIKELREADLSQVKPDEVREKLKSLGKVAVVMYTINKGRSIFRARAHKPDRLIIQPNELSYRRDLKNIGLGRANPSGFSVFYGAISSEEVPQGYIFSAYETSHLTREGIVGVETLTISKWNVVEDFEVVAIVSNPGYDLGFKLRAAMAKDQKDFIQEKFAQASEQQQLIAQFLGDQFAQQVPKGAEHNYLITAEASHRLYELGASGIAYPSVQSKYQGFNVALLPQTVDKYLQFDAALLTQLTREGNNLELRQYQIAQDFDGKELKYQYLDPIYALYKPYIEHI